MSLLIGPRPFGGHQYRSTLLDTPDGRYWGAEAMSPDQAWCSHSEPSARRWYSLVSNFRLVVLISSSSALRAAVTAPASSVLMSVTPSRRSAIASPSCWSSSSPTRPEMLGPTCHSAPQGLASRAGLKCGSLSERQPIPVVYTV